LNQTQGNKIQVAGVDVSYFEDLGIACAVLLSFPDFQVLEKKFAWGKPRFPYIPGFLAWREGGLCLGAVGKLKTKPDLLFVDGAGTAHPFRFGLATFLEERLQIPTIGVTKKRFVGQYNPASPERGSYSPIILNGEKIGAAVRTREGVRELFISPGKSLSIEEAIFWTLLFSKYRKPEPLCMAHQFSRLAFKERGKLVDHQKRENHFLKSP
jgi:deoxyribonuclease V